MLALDSLLHDAMPWSSAATSAVWFVLHVKSRQEKALTLDLTAAGVLHYLPLNRAVRYYGRRKVQVLEPLFPGYVFLKGSRDDAFLADRTRRVASILAVRDQVELERELTHLKEILDRAGFLTPAPLLVQGTKVEVVSGPFRGAVGEVASLHERNRLILQVNALGQGASLELDGSLVRPLDR